MGKNAENKEKKGIWKKVLAILLFLLALIILLLSFRSCNKSLKPIEDDNNDDNTQEVVHKDDDIDQEDDEVDVEHYSIVFVDDDGTVLSRYSLEYGDFPSYPYEIPNKTIDGYLYTFIGWSPLLHEVTGSQIYTATYNKEWVGGGTSGGGSSGPASTDAIVTYLNNVGIKTTIKIPAGTEISFNAGTNGSFSTQPENVTLTERQELDITVDPYIPTAGSGYFYKGYTYNNTTKVFTAVYITLPSQGNVITLNDNKTYKVISITNSEALLLAMFDVGSSKYWSTNQTIAFGSNQGTKYEGSALDTAMNNWYNSLNSGSTKPMHDAIIEQTDFKQHMYQWNSGTASGSYVAKCVDSDGNNYYITSVSDDVTLSTSRYVFALDIENVADFIGKEQVTATNVNQMFFDADTSDKHAWLASARVGYDACAWAVHGTGINLDISTTTTSLPVRPAFYIDLGEQGVNFNPTTSVIYLNSATGQKTKVYFPSGTTVSFNAGVGGTYSSTLDPYSLVDYVPLDITTNTYKPTENPGYTYKGYLVSNNRFTAQYSKDTTFKYNDPTQASTNPQTLYVQVGNTVTFDLNGGTFSKPTTINTTEAATYDLTKSPYVPSKAGYTFTGYTYDSTSKKFTASYSANTNTKYKVQYYTENITPGAYTLSETVTKEGTTDTTATAEQKTITGFTYDSLADGKVESGNIAGDGSLILKLYYKRNEYEVTFDNQSHGTAPQVQKVKYQAKATQPTALSETGYTFGGWYKDENCTNAWNFTNNTVTEDITLYAKWTINKYTVTITATPSGYGSVSPNKVLNVPYNTVLSTSTNTLDVDGTTVTATPTTNTAQYAYTFDSWTNGDATITGDTTVTASFKRDIQKYTVTWQEWNGTVLETDTDVEYGTTPTFDTTHQFTREPTVQYEYKYVGWDPALNASSKVTGDITYTAKYEETVRKYTVTFDLNGHGSSINSQSISYGSKATRPTNPSQAGYTFVDWYKDNTTFQNVWTFNTDTVTGATTLYAKWTKNTNTAYKVEHYTEDLTGGTYTLAKTDNLTGTTEESVTGAATSLTGFTYDDTKSTDTKTGNIVGDGSLVLKLYYSRNDYTVTFDTGDVDTDAIQDQTVKYGGKANEPKDVSVPGYDVEGYFEDAEFKTAWNFTNKTILDDATIYVKLKFVGFAVTFNMKGHGTGPGNATVARGQVLDLTDTTYKPVADPSYEFIGYEPPFKDAAFTANYRKTMPGKGDIVTITDSKAAFRFRVISIDDDGKALLLYMSKVDTSAYGNQVTTSFDGTDGIKYDGSSVDSTITSWVTTTPFISSIKDKIIDTTLSQNMYEYYANPDDATSFETDDSKEITYKYQYTVGGSGYHNAAYIGSASSITRKAFALDMKDIFEYFGKKVITADELNELFFETTSSTTDVVWLSSAAGTDKAWIVNGSDRTLQAASIGDPYDIRPAFYINLKTSGLTFTCDPAVESKPSDPTVTYINADGRIVTQIESVDVEVSFDAGDHGRFAKTLGSIKLNAYDNLDTRTTTYTPIAEEGYIFAGYNYGTGDHKLTASYKIIAKKGDIVTLSDNKTYRVLKIDNSSGIALLLGMEDLEDTVKYWDTNQTVPFNTTDRTKYEGSVLDTYLCNWYAGLAAGDESQKIIHNAIQKVKLTQHSYNFNEGTLMGGVPVAKGTYGTSETKFYITEAILNDPFVSIQNRRVFALDVEDVADYIGKDNFTTAAVNKMFFNTESSTNKSIWLRTADGHQEDEAWFVDGTQGRVFDSKGVTEALSVRPAFYIDLSCPGVMKDTDPSNPQIIYYDSNGYLQCIERNPGTYSFDKGAHGKFDTTPETQVVAYDAKVTLPKQPIDYTYTFDGWYKDENYTNLWKFDDDTVTENVTLYAKWTLKEFDVTISTDSTGYGTLSGTTSIEDIPCNSKITVSRNKLIINGEEIVAVPNESPDPDTSYTFDKWTINGDDVELTYDYSIKADLSIKAHFTTATKPKVKFTNTSSVTSTYTYNEGDIITINVGTKGTYEQTVNSPITLYTNDFFDLTQTPYIPTPNTGCQFLGYDYDSNTKTFTAKYNQETPIKGDVIKLNDGKRYRILSIDNNKVASVLALEPLDANVKYYDSESPDELTVKFGINEYSTDVYGSKYEGSTLDTYLNTTWYNSLANGTDGQKIIHDAIQDTTGLTQSMYKYFNSSYNGYVTLGGNGNYWANEFDTISISGSRKAYALDIQDIADYLGKDSFSGDAMVEMYYGAGLRTHLVWLRSAYYMSLGERTSVYAVDGVVNKYLSFYHRNSLSDTGNHSIKVQPAFTIDLAAEGIDYDFIEGLLYANVVYTDTTGNDAIAPILIGDDTVTVAFDAGAHGSYTTTPTALSLSVHDVENITGDEYKPTAADGYSYVGYAYDYDNHRFVAQYVPLPIKGDVIKLNDGKHYRVLSMNGNKAFVVSLENTTTSKYWTTNATTTFTDVSAGTGDKAGAKYDGSTLDTAMNTWYSNLNSDPLTQPMYSAIQNTTDLKQNMYVRHNEVATGDYVIKGSHSGGSGANYYYSGGYSEVDVSDKKVFALGVEDVLDYIGRDNLSQKFVNNLFFNTDSKPETIIWLSSANSTGAVYVQCIDGNYGSISHCGTSDNRTVRPAFTIDLKGEGVEFYYEQALTANVTYKDTLGNTFTVAVPAGVEISFSAGDHGSYATQPAVITLDAHENKNITGSAYIPSAYDGSTFNGYKYDYDTKTFIAQYSQELPVKGDIITLNDNHKYRVLSISGNNAFVMYMDDDVDTRPFNSSNTTAPFGGTNGLAYDASYLDVGIGARYTSASPFYGALIQKTGLVQHMYKVNYGDPSNNNYVLKGTYDGDTPYYLTNDYGTASIGNRYLYALDVQDIANYIGRDNISMTSLNQMFFNEDTVSDNKFVWLSSADGINADKALLVDSSEGRISAGSYDDANNVRYAFTINLKAPNVIYNFDNFYANVKYVNTKQEVETIAIPVDTTVEFNPTSAGMYSEEVDDINLNLHGLLVDLTVDKYKPTPRPGYAFNGYMYDYDTSTFIAQYIPLPIKGDIIALNDGNEYRVLKIDGSKALLLYMSDDLGKSKYRSDAATITFEDSIVGIKYEDSELDTALTGWYNNLASGTDGQKIIHDAIEKVDNYKQNIYQMHRDSRPSDTNYVARGVYGKEDQTNYYITGGYDSVAVDGGRYVFALDLQDVTNYFGKENLSPYTFNRMFFNDDSAPVSDAWLSSVAYNDGHEVLLVIGDQGVNEYDANTEHVVRPAFYIDLLADGITFTSKKQYANVKYYDINHELVILPLEADGSALHIDKGEHGSFSSHGMGGDPLLISHMVVDITNNPNYAITADENFIFTGYAYSYDPSTRKHSLVAQYEKELPIKGDIISLDSKQYRVLSIDGSNAFIMSMDESMSSAYGQDQTTTGFDTITRVAYQDSTLDTYINNWLSTTLSPNVQAAIKQKSDLTQSLYELHEGTPTDDDYIAKGEYGSGTNFYITKVGNDVAVASRFVYALGVEDVVDYIGRDNFTKAAVDQMFFNTETNTDKSIWLSSAYLDTDSDYAWIVSAGSTEGRLKGSKTDVSAQVRPAFTIDLRDPQVEYDLLDSDSLRSDLKYTDTTGNPFVMAFDKNTTVKFNAGDHGDYTGKDEGYEYELTLTDHTITDTTDDYEITADFGYAFKGYIFDSSTNTFTAQYKEIPIKGDIITLNNGKRYRVLSMDGSEAFVVSLTNSGQDRWANASQDIEFDNGVRGIKYEDSWIDGDMTTWYNNISSQAMKDAIVPVSLKQYMYTIYINEEPTGEYYARGMYTLNNDKKYYITQDGSVDISTPRYVYILDYKDIVDYVGRDNLYTTFIKDMFEGGMETASSMQTWSMSAVPNDGTKKSAYVYRRATTSNYGFFNKLSSLGTTSRYEFPAFHIDLLKEGVEFTLDSTKYANVIYTDTLGNPFTVAVKSGSTIKFDGGIHGEFATPKSDITLTDHQLLDITSYDNDISNVDANCTFTGFRYDYDTNTFIAQYHQDLPVKGDIITLNDEKKYRVLSIDGSKAMVLYMEDDLSSKYWENNVTGSFGDVTGTIAKASDIFKYANNTWYEGLNANETTKPMYSAAIQANLLYQNMYLINDGVPLDNNYYAKGIYSENNKYYISNSFGIQWIANTDKALILGVEHIVDYLGRDNISSYSINQMFFNGVSSNKTIWLSSADAASSDKAMIIDGSTGSISSDSVVNEYYARPAFTLDLKGEGVSYSFVDPIYANVTYTDTLGNPFTVAIPSGTTISFSAGSHGTYSSEREDIALQAHDVIDITGNDYIPTVEHLYNYNGYAYDFENHVFNVQYEQELPIKGDIVKLNDNKQYRVLKTIDDNGKVLLLALDSIGAAGQSNVDSTLSTWYNGLNDGATKPIHDAIIESSITKDTYAYVDGEPGTNVPFVAKGTYGTGNNYYLTGGENPATVDNVHAFALDIKDITDYISNDVFTKKSVNNMFFGADSSVNNIWLSSAGESGYGFRINGSTGKVESIGTGELSAIHPAFYFNLKGADVVYSIVPDSVSANVTYINSSGKEVTIALPADTEIKFGEQENDDRGQYIEIPSSIVLGEHDSINLVDEQYYPEPNYKYTFVGFIFDETTNTLITDYGPYIPKKGDLVLLNDGKVYRALADAEVNGSDEMIVKFLSMSNCGIVPFETTKTDVTVTMRSGTEKSVANYDGSSIDTAMDAWYETLDDSNDTLPMYSAILEKQFNCYAYENQYQNKPSGVEDSDIVLVSESFNNNAYYYYYNKSAPISVGLRHAFALDLQDIADYFNGAGVRCEELSQMVYNDGPKDKIWLSSIGYSSNKYTHYIYNDVSRVVIGTNSTYDGYIRPVFYINLKGEGVLYKEAK